jgi:hypothetical protein
MNPLEKRGKGECTYCVSPEAREYPNTAFSVLLVVNKNKKIPVKAVESAIVTFLPPMANLYGFFLV